jgi:hypothetical protein
MIIIWGSRLILITIGSGTFICPRCQVTRQFRHRRFVRFFTLYYIPLFPIGEGQHFVECRGCQSHFIPEVLSQNGKSAPYRRHYPVLMAYGLVLAVIVMLFGLVNLQTYVQDRQAAQQSVDQARTQTTIFKQFGEANFTRCHNLATTAGWEVTTDSPHILAVDAKAGSLDSDYQAALPTNLRATNQQDLTHILCVQQNQVELSKDNYGDKNDTTTIYTCLRYRVNVEVFLIDVQSDSVVGYHKVSGGLPQTCPDQTDDNLTYFGTAPSPAQVIQAVFPQ